MEHKTHKMEGKREFGEVNYWTFVSIGILIISLHIGITGCESSPQTGLRSTQTTRVTRTPTYWKVVLPEPYDHMNVGATKIGLNMLFVRTKEEAEEYRKQGAHVEPWYEDNYGGFKIIPKGEKSKGILLGTFPYF